MNERAQQIKHRFEVPVLVAALLVVPVIIIEEQAASAQWLGVATVSNWLIWAAFLAEFASVIAVTDDRWGYTREAWLDVVIIVASFPLLPGLLASIRLLRLLRLTSVFRLLRLVRLAAVITRGTKTVQAIFGRRGVGFAMALTVLGCPRCRRTIRPPRAGVRVVRRCHVVGTSHDYLHRWEWQGMPG